MNFRFAILVTSLLIFGCDNRPTSPDARQVYASALPTVASGIEHFTIEAKKVQLGTGNQVPSKEKIDEFGRFSFSGSSSHFTKSDFPNLDVTLMSDADLEEIASSDCEAYWSNFRAKSQESTGLLRISEVGFSESGAEAVFYVEGGSGCTAGRGVLVFMRLEAGQWVVANLHELWVS